MSKINELLKLIEDNSTTAIVINFKKNVELFDLLDAMDDIEIAILLDKENKRGMKHISADFSQGDIITVDNKLVIRLKDQYVNNAENIAEEIEGLLRINNIWDKIDSIEVDRNAIKSRQVGEGKVLENLLSLVEGSTSRFVIWDGSLSNQEVRDKFAEMHKEAVEYHKGSDSGGYTGDWDTFEGIKVDDKDAEFGVDDLKHVKDWILDHSEKWGYAWAKKAHHDGAEVWVVGGWAAE